MQSFVGDLTTLKGKEVEFETQSKTYNGRNTEEISRIKVVGHSANRDIASDKSSPKEGTKDHYWKQKEEREIENQPKTTRIACLNAACDLYNVDLNDLNLEKIDGTVKAVISTAMEFVDFVESDKDKYEARHKDVV